MKVLIACEESQRVCIAFRVCGHESYSCDIQDCSGGHPEWHIKGDALEAIRGGTTCARCFDPDNREIERWYGRTIDYSASGRADFRRSTRRPAWCKRRDYTK